MEKELIYDIMNGFYDVNSVYVPKNVEIVDEFADGKECNRLCEQIYDARICLAEKLGNDEDKDVEIIINCMNSIMRHLAMKMFEYGRLNPNM